MLQACGGGSSGLTITPPETTTVTAGMQAFAAMPPTVNWSVREGDVGGWIETTGLYTAPDFPGRFTVVAVEPSSGLVAEAPITVEAQTVQLVHGMSIPNTHPRLWFNPARLATARAWYRANPFTPSRDDYTGWALRGLLGNDAAACRTAINWAVTTSGDGTFSVPGGVACDECRWMGESSFLVYDWCYAYMTEQERSLYRANTTTWVENWRTKPWPGLNSESNYFLAYLRNEVLWGILLHGDDNTAAARLLDYAFRDRIQDTWWPAATTGRQKGGVGREGTTYGRHHYGYFPVAWASVGVLGRDILAEAAPYWPEVAYYLIYQLQPAPTTGAGRLQPASMGYTFWPFNDTNPTDWLNSGTGSPNTDQTDFMTLIAWRWPNSAVGQHARQYLNTVSNRGRSRHVIALDASGATAVARPFGDLPLDYYAPGGKIFNVRSAWGPNATTVWMMLGEEANGHAQTDWGTWQLWRNGRYLSRESVAYTHTITNYAGNGTVDARYSAVPHNGLLVNGVGNRAPTVQGGFPATTPNVRRLESRPGYAFASVDLTPLQDRADRISPFWVHWERDFLFVRDLETLVVLDRVQSTDPAHVKTFLAHCEVAPTLDGAAPNRSFCTNGPQQLVHTTLVPTSGVTHRIVDEIGGSLASAQWRVEADTVPNSAQSYVLTVLQAKDTTAPALAPSVVEDGTGFTVTLDATHSIRLAKGMVSSGGSITIGSTTTSLRTGVQTLTVSESGPAWQ